MQPFAFPPAPPACPLCHQALSACRCGTTPARDPTPTPTSYVKRYGVTYCRICDLAAIYCKGHVPSGQPAADGAESGLARRIAEVRK